MCKSILFSALGTTDPISNFRDGSMLHICRVYKPDIVYLYLSKEMCDFHDRDNRYLYCLKELEREIDHKFEVHLFKKIDLIDAHKYDYFYKEFREIVGEIKAAHSDATLYLNVSSGTPAMKSALQVLGVLSEYPMKSIQVSSPFGKSNEKTEDKLDYDVKIYWELNEDNQFFKNRCEESIGVNLLAEIMREVMVKHVDAYDYVAALQVAETIKEHIPGDVFTLLKAMNWRLQLNVSNVTKELNGLDYDLLPEKNSENRDIVEYILLMKKKVLKEEYSDVIRGLTPIMTSLFVKATKVLCSINVMHYCEKNKNKYGNDVIRWSIGKLQRNPALLDILNNHYNGFRAELLSTESMTVIIKNICNDKRADDIICLNEIENKIRNRAAHTIVSVTEESIIKDTGYTPKQILDMLRSVAVSVGINVNTNVWNSYDKINTTIKSLLS